MSRIVHASPVPKGDFYVTDVPFYNRVRPDRLDAFFEAAEPAEGDLAEILLANDATAIYHLGQENIGQLGDYPFVRPVLLGVNYNRGHSEGAYKTVVQDIPQRRGPWVLFKPPGSEETTFFLQHLVFPGIMEAEFVESPANPLKIDKRFLFKGDPLKIFDTFRALGYSFVDEPMTEEYMEQVGYSVAIRIR